MKDKPTANKCACGLPLKPENDICDVCVIKKFGLEKKGRYSNHSSYIKTYDEHELVEALRQFMKNHNL